MKTAYCEYCKTEIKLHKGRFIPHGDLLGSCPNTGRKVFYLFRCTACGDEWTSYKMPKKCVICGNDEFIQIK
jgi:DNA polymerase II large subunit